MDMIRHVVKQMLGRNERRGPQGEVRFHIASGAQLERDLSIIPSETSLAERMYLYYLAREITGTGNILELGPFLGGTTRALARGLEHSGSDARRLVTVDRFENYYEADEFGQLGVTDVEAGSASVKFRSLFDAYHRDETYYRFIDVRTAKVADLPNEVTDYSFLDELDDIRIVFIDGCKSWYSVKNFVSAVIERTAVGTWYLFQDYGRYTCFWIPAFVELFPDHFRFVCSVGSTYVYRLEKPLSKAEINDTYSDEPEEMSADDLDSLFLNVFERERRDGRIGGMVTSKIQIAAFHAYIGDKQKARDLLRALLVQDYVRGNLRARVQEAMVSPTYSPNEKILL